MVGRDSSQPQRAMTPPSVAVRFGWIPHDVAIGGINPSMTATLGGIIDVWSGLESSATITKTGLGTLVISSSFTGSIITTGGGLSLFADGDGKSTREDILFAGITLGGPATINVGRLGTERLPLFTLAANKT